MSLPVSLSFSLSHTHKHYKVRMQKNAHGQTLKVRRTERNLRIVRNCWKTWTFFFHSQVWRLERADEWTGETEDDISSEWKVRVWRACLSLHEVSTVNLSPPYCCCLSVADATLMSWSFYPPQYIICISAGLLPVLSLGVIREDTLTSDPSGS